MNFEHNIKSTQDYLAQYLTVYESTDVACTFTFENNMQIFGIGASISGKYTLEWAANSTLNEQEFVDFVNEQIANKLGFDITVADKRNLLTHYNINA
jgi:hypothetical protein